MAATSTSKPMSPWRQGIGKEKGVRKSGKPLQSQMPRGPHLLVELIMDVSSGVDIFCT